jgi:hypothetical protein
MLISALSVLEGRKDEAIQEIKEKVPPTWKVSQYARNHWVLLGFYQIFKEIQYSSEIFPTNIRVISFFSRGRQARYFFFFRWAYFQKRRGSFITVMFLHHSYVFL